MLIPAIGVCLMLACGPSAPAEVVVLPGSSEPIVTVVGEILPNDFDKFRDATASITKALVGFSSKGGSVLDAISIGRLIRLKNFATVVVDGDRCASACALAWLGGTRRFMGRTALIGFHAAYNQQTGQETGMGNAIIGAFHGSHCLQSRSRCVCSQLPLPLNLLRSRAR